MEHHTVFNLEDELLNLQQDEMLFVDAAILQELSQTDPELAEFYTEMTNMLIRDFKWDGPEASRYVLNWAAHNYFGDQVGEQLESVRVIY